MKIATICDNYKVEMFRDEFNKAGIIFTEKPFTKDTTCFTTIGTPQSKIKPIVDRVTQYFIDKYKKQN
jgi:hypothetical protein